MATDLGQIVLQLTQFYDFAGKTVLDVGAGGGQLVDYARAARRVIAIDRDAAALAQLDSRLGERGWSDRFEILRADFLDVRSTGDVVLFEFCLHEMAEPTIALAHAREGAADVLVIDHAPGSEWSWYAAEDQAIETAWKAVESRTVHRQQTIEELQRFEDFDELAAKLVHQGPTSRERIEPFRGQRDISIPMPYRLVLLS